MLDLTAEAVGPEYPGRPYTDLTAADWLLVADGVPVDTTALEHSGIPCPDGYTLYRNPRRGWSLSSCNFYNPACCHWGAKHGILYGYRPFSQGGSMGLINTIQTKPNKPARRSASARCWKAA